MYTTFKIIGSSEYRNVGKFINKRAALFRKSKGQYQPLVKGKGHGYVLQLWVQLKSTIQGNKFVLVKADALLLQRQRNRYIKLY